MIYGYLWIITDDPYGTLWLQEPDSVDSPDDTLRAASGHQGIAVGQEGDPSK